jgi:mono/diheme cytochrome c family protein
MTLAGVLCLAALAAGGCGSGKVQVPTKQVAAHKGAELFNQRCGGCHSIHAANAYGSKPEGVGHGGERTNGPDFNSRKIKRDDALFAIRNGGFSGAIMPANIVVGKDATKVADFLEKYSGANAGNPNLRNPDVNK